MLIRSCFSYSFSGNEGGKFIKVKDKKLFIYEI